MTAGPVLFPTDGSACAERARPYAERLAAALGAPLLAVRVEPSPFATSTLVGPAVAAAFDGPLVSAADVAADLHLPAGGEGATGGAAGGDGAGTSPPAPPAAVRFASDPARGICAYAAETGAGLVVMGTHGRRGTSRLLLGSVAESVLRRAPCPVLVVPSASDATGAAATLDGGLVLAADDLTDAAASALREGARLAGLLGGTLDVLHVIEDLHLPVPYGIVPLEAFSLETVLPRIKAALTTRSAKARVPVHCHVRMGDPADAIAAAARDGGAALVVMGSHGRQGVDRVLMGSTAEALVRQAPCPVLVVRPRVPSPAPPAPSA